jgi:hypothetical protein
LPDGLAEHIVRGLHRTNFNFAIGRDWWLKDVGYLRPQPTGVWNTRLGMDVGGRWGTSHVDLVPARIDNPRNDYLRKRSTTHAVFVSFRTDWERQVGGWIFFTGVRSQLDYTWTNVVPPKGGDIVGINFLFHAGVRY